MGDGITAIDDTNISEIGGACWRGFYGMVGICMFGVVQSNYYIFTAKKE